VRFADRFDLIEHDVLDVSPTLHPPGSIDKIDAMRKRVERGYSPFHPEDESIMATIETQLATAEEVLHRVRVGIYANRRRK
jgi:hypothetical protein